MLQLSDNPSTVNSTSVGDPLLVAEVTQALRHYDTAGFGRIHVSSNLGVVTLSGSVPTWYARSLAYQLARRQPRVNRVVDALRVVQSAGREFAR